MENTYLSRRWKDIDEHEVMKVRNVNVIQNHIFKHVKLFKGEQRPKVSTNLIEKKRKKSEHEKADLIKQNWVFNEDN